MSSVLETFLILFESDASEAKKGVDDLNKSLDGSEKSADSATKAAADFSDGAQKLSSESKKAADSLSKLSSEEAVNPSQIDGLNDLNSELDALSDINDPKIGEKISISNNEIQSLKKGEKGVEDLTEEIKEADEATDSMADQFVMLGKTALGAVAGVFALGSVVSDVLAKAQSLDDLQKFSTLIGENVADVNAWEEAVIRAGGTAESFRGSVESLNEKVVDASVKGFNEVVPFFNQLGISIVDVNGKARSTLDLLPELADSFQRLSKQESAGLGKKIGLDNSTILLLQSGRREVDALIKKQRELGGWHRKKPPKYQPYLMIKLLILSRFWVSPHNQF